MKNKNKLFTDLLVFGFLIFFGVQIMRMIKDVFITHQKNENSLSSKKDLSNREDLIKKRSDEIFNSKLNKAKIKGLSRLSFDDGRKSYFRAGYEDLKLGYLVNFSTKIKYDNFTNRFRCIESYQSVDPISKDIKIYSGSCSESRPGRKCDDSKFKENNYIRYRANDEKNIRYYYPKIVVEFEKDSAGYTGIDEYRYYKVLPYSFFKDFEKISLRYDTVSKMFDRKNYNYQTVTSEFDPNSVLIINNLKRRCNLTRSIFN